MKRLLRIARTEVLEHRRQPWMLFVLCMAYVFWAAVVGLVVLIIQANLSAPEHSEQFQRMLRGFGVDLKLALKTLSVAFVTTMFTNLPIIVAYHATNSLVHDRDVGALPFLMLAPLTRTQVLLGKLAGVMAIPLLLHVVLGGSTCLILGRVPALEPYGAYFGVGVAWWVAFLVSAPVTALFMGALGFINSSLSSDVRTSVQSMTFTIAVLNIVLTAGLVGAIEYGVLLQLAYIVLVLIAAALTLAIGARLISRDVTA